MKRVKLSKRHLWNLYVFPLVLFVAVACYPTGKPDNTQDSRDEKHFPNGTVIGKYTYVDNEGNPIQVKYYADDASYGVELKSIKVVDATGEPIPTDNAPNVVDSPTKYDYNIMKNKDRDPDLKMSADMLENYPSNSYKYNKNSDPYDFLNKEVNKANRYKIEKPNSPDYEIYYQNEVKGPKKCSKEKVRVYLDKDSRKIRSAVNEADKFCEQF